jgi:hypothetical protein
MKMEAGLDLDARIAKEVMGCMLTHDAYRPQCGCPTDPTSDKRPHQVWAPHAGGFIIPPYSTDIAAAWTVKERLGRLMELQEHTPFGWLCRFMAVQPGQIDVEARADTAPLAICCAALLAVEAREKEKL